MAVASEAFALCRSILDVVFKLEQIKEDWFTVSDDCRAKVLVLSAKLKIVKDHVDDRDLPEDYSIVKILKSAEAKVRKEELKVEKFQAGIDKDRCWGWAWWIWAKMKALLFPERLEQTIKNVIEEINNIPALLKMDEEVSAQFYKFDQRRAVRSTFYDNDGLYVPLSRTQSAVIEAIEKGLNYQSVEGKKSAVITPVENGRLVVLLHGGVGTGKTILARYVCKYYQGTTLFDHVHWESCGPDFTTDPSTKMLDIFKSLSPATVSDSPQNAQKISRARIISQLKNFLKGKRILIILDHVADEEFLLEMTNVAQGCPNVKYLVTSQIPHLCHNMRQDTQEVSMRDTTKHEAREILAALVGLEPRLIPIKLQEVTDKVIAATEGNPLALACWAGNFCSSQNKIDEQTWWDAYGNLRNILNGPEKKLVLGSIERRSVWEALELCIKSSRIAEAKIIFFFIYACAGASVPEEVLKNWHEYLHPESIFWSSRDELSSRGLMEGTTSSGLTTYLEEKDGDQNLRQSTSWSLRPLVKLFIEYHLASTNEGMKNDIVSVVDTFLGDKKCSPESSAQPKPATAIPPVEIEKAKTAVALCALYFDPAHADPIVNDIAKRARSLSNTDDSDCSVIVRRKRAMEPIIWLLGQSKRTTWTEESLSSARKIFLTYICEHQLHGDGLSALLTLDVYPPAQLATLTALLAVFTEEVTVPHCENAPRLLLALLILLDSKSRHSTSFNVAAYEALEVVLGSFLKSFSQQDKADMHLQGALALSVLAFGDEHSIGKKVVKENRAVADLVRSVCGKKKGDLTDQVTKALRKITLKSSDSVDLKIVAEEMVLAGLVNVFSEDGKAGLQEDALVTLSQLCIRTGDSRRAAIANTEGLLAGLVKFFYEDNVPRLQEEAIRCFFRMAKCDALRPKLASEPGALPGLVRCLSITALQLLAARTLSNLSATKVCDIEIQIKNEDGMIAGLLTCFPPHNETELRNEAMKTFANVVYNDRDSAYLAMAKEAGALEGVVAALSDRDNSTSRVVAARVLRILSSAYADSIKLQIMETECALSGLVDAVAAHNNDTLQVRAAQVVLNLATTKDASLKLKIMNQEQALARLVECLSEGKPELQGHVADVFKRLAEATDVSVRLKLKNEKGLITGLVSLTKHDDASLQTKAKGALSALGELELAK